MEILCDLCATGDRWFVIRELGKVGESGAWLCAIDPLGLPQSEVCRGNWRTAVAELGDSVLFAVLFSWEIGEMNKLESLTVWKISNKEGKQLKDPSVTRDDNGSRVRQCSLRTLTNCQAVLSIDSSTWSSDLNWTWVPRGCRFGTQRPHRYVQQQSQRC